MTLNHVVWTTWAWRTEWSHVSKVCWVRRKEGANKCWSWVELRVEWTKWRNIWAAQFEQCGVFSASLPLLVLYCVMKDYSALWGVGLLMFLIFLSFSLCPPSLLFLYFYMSHCVAQALLNSFSPWLGCPNAGLAKTCYHARYIFILAKCLIASL